MESEVDWLVELVEVLWDVLLVECDVLDDVELVEIELLVEDVDVDWLVLEVLVLCDVLEDVELVLVLCEVLVD